MVERGFSRAIAASDRSTIPGLRARRGGPRVAPAPRRPRASEPRATRRRRPNAPAAPRRSSLEPPPRPLCGLLRPSPAADRRAARGLREFSYGSSRAYGRAALMREPPVPPGVIENPGEARVRVFGYGMFRPPPFQSPKLPRFRMRRPRTPPPLFWEATLRPAAFLGFALRLPRLGRAPGGVLRNAKVRPDVRPPRAQRPGRPFLSRDRRFRPTRLRGGC